MTGGTGPETGPETGSETSPVAALTAGPTPDRTHGPMPGETDLSRLLATLSPRLDPVPHGFALAATPPARVYAALVVEDEGLTVIAPVAALQAEGLAPGAPFARITLTVHSSLQAVGLTAAVSAALAAEGIPANMVAGLRHDHVFVPWERQTQAMQALARLSEP